MLGKPRAKSKAAPKSRGRKKVKNHALSRKVTPSRIESPDSLDKFVDAVALALDLPLDPAWRPAVRMNLQITLRQVALFADFDLPDGAEPAAVFRA
ncbi:MAG TPA: DUF4089 domain-containing protein [Steroidobacteraceae bacterium]